VIENIAPIREKVKQLKSDKKNLDRLMALGAEKARKIAQKTLKEVYEKVGLVTAI
jgi:tryptophanyl-tRNA synthetase